MSLKIRDNLIWYGTLCISNGDPRMNSKKKESIFIRKSKTWLTKFKNKQITLMLKKTDKKLEIRNLNRNNNGWTLTKKQKYNEKGNKFLQQTLTF